MSSRPQGFSPIQTSDERPGKHHHHAHSAWVFVLPVLLCFLLILALVWWMERREIDQTKVAESSAPATEKVADAASEPIDPAAVAPAATARQPDRKESITSSPAATTASGMSLSFRDQRARIQGAAGIYETAVESNGGNSVDTAVKADLAKLGIKPANRCSDEAFVRRVYVDTLGTIPTARQAREFLDNREVGKREKLIKELLERPEFADYWAMKWCDTLRVKAEFPINLWPNAAQAYHRWIRNAIKDNLPYDRFAYELLTASGSNFRTPQVNFYRALQSQDPEAIASVAALTFLCERTEHWPKQRLQGMAQFFCKVGFKPTDEWKEEIVFYDSRREGSGSPNDPVVAVYPSGARVTIPAGKDPREVFASWLINKKNPWFARAMANRVWYWLMGRGIVDPPDDVRADNPPSNLALLNHLADELIAADFDLKHLYRLILNSDTYQSSCIPASEDSRAQQHFAYYRPRRLDAEVLIDAICQITETTETYMSIIPEPYTFLPQHQRAIALPDGSITSSFLEMFGRPSRDTGLADERNNRLTASQALHLLNSNHLRNKLKRGKGLQRVFQRARDEWDTTNLLYLTILSRRPTESELQIGGQLCDDERGTQELAWALINSDEFLFRH